MPTISEGIYPRPTSWSEFENICKDAFELKWNVTHLVKNGRSGQKQDGVDVYGILYDGYHGIQCKNTVSTISEKLVRDECAKAENFQPTLKNLYIATTAVRDVKIQEFIRKLNVDRISNGMFSVEIIFWDDIIHDLSKSEEIIKKHYPQFFHVSKSRVIERDLIILRKYCQKFDFNYQERLKNELFGKMVPRDLIDNITDFYFYEGNNPDWHFSDAVLEGYRIEFMNSIFLFQQHFKEQSGGMIDYYDFVDLNEWLEKGDETYNRGRNYVRTMQKLSYDVAEKIMCFLDEKKNRGLY